MTFEDYWGILRRSWVFVVLTPLLGALVAFGISKAATPVYQAEATVFVTVNVVGEASTSNSLDQLMSAYAALATGDNKLAAMAQELAIPGTTKELSDRVKATAEPGTSFLIISAEASTAEQAAAMANSISSAIAKEIPDRGSSEAIVSTNKRGIKKATITVEAEIVEPARPPIGPISPKTLSNTSVGFLLGLMVGVAAPIARASLTPRVRGSRDLENATGAPFLGRVRRTESAENHSNRDDLTLVRAALIAQNDLPSPLCFVVAAVDETTDVRAVAGGLASALGDDGAVLLVATDVQSDEPGWAELLSGQIGLNDVAVTQEGRGFDLIPAGRSTSRSATSTQLTSLYADLKQRYSWIIVQAPALNVSAEAALLSTRSDGVVVVAEQNRTGMRETVDGCDAIHRTGARVLGALLV